jgi:amino acid adenylation domain-containing protein
MIPDPTQCLDFEFEHSIIDLFSNQVTRTPNALAIIDSAAAWTYRDLDESSSRIAANLREAGLHAGSVVTIEGRRDASLVIAIIGALKAGAPFCILDPNYPAARLALQIRSLAPAALLCRSPAAPEKESLVDLHRQCGCHSSILIDSVLRQREADGAIQKYAPRIEGRDVAYYLFTSGTTGMPKAVSAPQHALPHFLKWYVRRFEFSQSDRFCMCSGLAHDPLLRDIFTPLSIGAALHIPPADLMRDPARLSAWFGMQKISVAHLTPSLLRMLCNSSDATKLPDLHYAVLGGERLLYKDVAWIKKIAQNVIVVNGYGATETPQLMAYHVVDPNNNPPETVVPLGTGIRDVQLLIINSETRLARVGEVGEICVRTPYLSNGYLDAAEDVPQRYVSNPFKPPNEIGSKHDALALIPDLIYKTGDTGQYDSAGNVHYIGRLDNQVKIRGFRVELGEIESTLRNIIGVTHAAVCCDDSAGHSRIIAWIEPTSQFDMAECKSELTRLLPDYAIPSHLHQISPMPLSPNGKVDIALLRAALSSKRTSHIAARDTANQVEQTLITIWEQVLALQPIGVLENFFELGGDSLLAAGLLSAIANRFGKHLPMSSLLNAATIREQAAILSNEANNVQSLNIVPLKSGDTQSPAYWIPGGGGLSVVPFKQVSELINSPHAVFGLELSPGDSTATLDLQAKAAKYVAAIRSRQKTGPYRLLGFSAGSWLAYEMATQLIAQGETVTLVVFDTEVTSFTRSHHWQQISAYSLAHHLRNMLNVPITRWVKYAKHTAQEIYWGQLRKRNAMKWDPRLLDRKADVVLGDAFVAADNASRKAAYEYAKRRTASEYPGRIVVVVAEEDALYAGVNERLDPRLGWRRLARRGIEVHRVQGSHISMLQEPHVGPFAEVLSAILAESATNGVLRTAS